jgi:hypothetical protein
LRLRDHLRYFKVVKNTTSAGPLSVPLPAALRRRLNRYAAQRQLKVATAARTLLDEKLKELDERADVSRIEEWQRAQAWASWEEVARGDAALLDLQEVLAAFDKAVQPKGRPRK